MLGFAELPERIAALRRRARAARGRAAGRVRVGVRATPRRPSVPAAAARSSRCASQFPSTTTAHLTTLYSGLPVTEHGLYEWRCYEPLVGDVIRPLPFALADSDAPLPITPQQLFPWPSAFERRRRPAAARGDRGHAVRLGGARGRDDRAVRDDRGGRGAARRRARADVPVLGRDRRHRPSPRPVERRRSTPRVAAGAGRAGERRRRRCWSTADHGQIDVDETDDLDVLVAAAARATSRAAPAGSARDLFLHVDDPETCRRRAVRPARRPGARLPRRRRSSPTSARACASASPTSASSPRRAGWSA